MENDNIGELEELVELVTNSPSKKVFDWDKASKIILENDIRNAEAFLKNQESYTAGCILCEGEAILDSEAYLETYKDIPTLRDMDTKDEYPCWKFCPSCNWTVTALSRLNRGNINDK